MLMSGSKNFASVKNPYSWNKVSNLLFFESPAGVGFSINDDKNYVYNDTRTAQDALKALQLFYQRFPEFKANNFWIAGESYCGMYIPFMANEILTQDTSIKLQGILIGNGAMWLNWNWRRMIGDRFWLSHYYLGPEIAELLSKCKYTDQDPRIPSCAKGIELAEKVYFFDKIGRLKRQPLHDYRCLLYSQLRLSYPLQRHEQQKIQQSSIFHLQQQKAF